MPFFFCLLGAMGWFAVRWGLPGFPEVGRRFFWVAVLAALAVPNLMGQSEEASVGQGLWPLVLGLIVGELFFGRWKKRNEQPFWWTTLVLRFRRPSAKLTEPSGSSSRRGNGNDRRHR